MLATILALILVWKPTWYPPGGGPETDAERAERRTMVAHVIHEAAGAGITELWPADNAALLMTVFSFESGRLDYRVHGGEVSPIGTQDGMKARCLGQIHQNSMNDDDWEALAGRDRAATVRCATRVLQIIRYHLKRCKVRYDQGQAGRWRAPLTKKEASILFMAYGSGTSCRAGGYDERVKAWKQTRDKLM